MKNKNRPLASEIIADRESRLQMAVAELDIVTDDLLEKGKFALMELMDASKVYVDDTPSNRTDNLNRAHMLADIAYDYLAKAQSTLISIVIREQISEGGQQK